MTALYKLIAGGGVIRAADGASIPPDPANTDYLAYLAWADGNTADPADPAPLAYSGGLTIDTRLRTTTATPTEIYRATLAQVTIYRAKLELLGVDAGNGNARYIAATVVAKRLANGALLVGAPAVLANLQDAGASTWAIAAAANGNDFVVTVTGQASRNIDWYLSGGVVSFTPGGA